MEIQFEPDKNLFGIFLLINGAGYDVENNPLGMHPVRELFRSELRDIEKKDPRLFQMLTVFRTVPLPRDDLIRFAHFAVWSNKKNHLFEDATKNKMAQRAWKNLEGDFIAWVDSPSFLRWFRQYHQSLVRVVRQDRNRIIKVCREVLDFFHLGAYFPLEFILHLNLLDSFRRGTNYTCPRKKIISVSLTFEQCVDERSVRHEMMHLLLNKILPSGKIFSDQSFPVSPGYAQDGPRVQFEENFIQAANTFFLSEEQHQRQLKYYEHLGFTKIRQFDQEMKKAFVIEKKSLGPNVLKEFVSACSLIS